MEHSITLVIFTFLSQLAIGGFVALFLIETYKQNLNKRSSFISLMAILGASVVAVIVSVFHLGHPFQAYKALLNFADSWLSREIVFFPLFILFVLMYAFVAKTEKMKKVTGWVAIVLGAITIVCTSMIYVIPAVPGWDNGMTVAAFFMTALLLGPVFIQFLLSVLEGKVVNFSLYTAIVSGVAILFNILYISIAKGGFAEAVETSVLLTSSPLFWVKMALLVLGFGMAVYAMVKKVNSSVLVAITFFGFFIAEFIGRILFYSTGVHL